MIDDILTKIQEDIRVSNQLNETINEFKSIVENFNFSIEYFEESYKIGESSAQAVEFIKNLAGHVTAVNDEYKKLTSIQADSVNTTQTHITQITQKFEKRMDRQFNKIEKYIQLTVSSVIEDEFSLIYEKIEETDEKINNIYLILSDIKTKLDTIAESSSESPSPKIEPPDIDEN